MLDSLWQWEKNSVEQCVQNLSIDDAAKISIDDAAAEAEKAAAEAKYLETWRDFWFSDEDIAKASSKMTLLFSKDNPSNLFNTIDDAVWAMLSYSVWRFHGLPWEEVSPDIIHYLSQIPKTEFSTLLNINPEKTVKQLMQAYDDKMTNLKNNEITYGKREQSCSNRITSLQSSREVFLDVAARYRKYRDKGEEVPGTVSDVYKHVQSLFKKQLELPDNRWDDKGDDEFDKALLEEANRKIAELGKKRDENKEKKDEFAKDYDDLAKGEDSYKEKLNVYDTLQKIFYS